MISVESRPNRGGEQGESVKSGPNEVKSVRAGDIQAVRGESRPNVVKSKRTRETRTNAMKQRPNTVSVLKHIPGTTRKPNSKHN